MKKKSPRSPVSKQPKMPRKDTRWTLLFLGDRGKTVTFKHFKLVVVAALFFLLSSAATAGWFWYLYKGSSVEIANHEKRIDTLKKAVLSLRNEKDILMARLVVAESRVEENLAKATQSKETQPKEKREPKSPAPSEPVTPKATAKSKASVIADDFIIFHEPDINTLRIHYKVRNLGSREQPVSGRTVVVLKDDDDDPIKWVVLPKVPLRSGKPTGQYGRSFSIYNYRTMKFNVVDASGPEKFKSADVYIFSTTGELVFEKTFPVGVQSVPKSSY